MLREFIQVFLQVQRWFCKCWKLGSVFSFHSTSSSVYRRCHFSERSQNSYVDYSVTKILTNKELFTNARSLGITFFYRISFACSITVRQDHLLTVLRIWSVPTMFQKMAGLVPAPLSCHYSDNKEMQMCPSSYCLNR